MTFILSFLAGPLGKFAAMGAAVLAVLLAATIWLHTHDAVIRAQDVAAVNAATAATQKQDSSNAIKAVEAEAATQRVKDAQLSDDKDKVSHDQDANSAVTDPAVLDALRLLNASSGNGRGSTRNPSKSP